MMTAAPFYSDVAEGPDGGQASWVVTSDGCRIRIGHWTGADVKGTILIFPGRTEYIEKYGRDAAVFLEKGYATVAIDWRGQGIADRLIPNAALGHVESFRDYQHDVAATVRYAEEAGLPRPYFLLGHSMGGCIGLRSLHEGLNVKAAAFSAPMWGIQMAAALRPVAWSISSLSRGIGLSHLLAPGQQIETYLARAEFELNTLTSDRDSFDYMRRQVMEHPDLSLGGPSLQWLNEALVEMKNLHRLPPPHYPTVTFVGTDEQIVCPTRIHRYMERWQGGDLTVIQGGRHEILMEKPETRAMVIDRICAHFDHYAENSFDCSQSEIA